MIRKKLQRICVIAIALMLCLSLCKAQQIEAQDKVLPNFYRVNENLYRGAQPKSGGLKMLSALGIKTIINLRTENTRIRDEEIEAIMLGIQYFSVPLAGFSRPTDEQVEKVLAIINDPKNQPVFVHCNHGADRTGTIIACYRITHDGWTKDRVQAEAKHFRMSRFQFGMKDYISDYYKRYHSSHTETTVTKRATFLLPVLRRCSMNQNFL
ncbi:MAG: hypothetical protein NVSMB56_10470 [Pyrinomonadaceae bacterium]